MARVLRSRKQDADAVPAAGTADENELCVICQMPMGTDCCSLVAFDGCGHRFHGQCLCDHLLRDQRCPICRHTIAQGEEEDDSNALESHMQDLDEHVSRVSIAKQALTLASRHKADKKTRAMLETMHRWNGVRTAMSKQKKSCDDMLRPMRRQANDSLRMHAESTWATFAKDHRDLLTASASASKELRKAKHLHTQARRRLIEKYTPFLS